MRRGSKLDRAQARAAAMQLIYEKEMGGDGGIDTRAGMLEIAEEDKNTAFMEELYAAAEEHMSEIDEKIASFLRSGWRLERISRVDLCILRIGVAEMCYCGTPAPVAINEAVVLSQKYSTEEIGSFINGVLGSISRAMAQEKA